MDTVTPRVGFVIKEQLAGGFAVTIYELDQSGRPVAMLLWGQQTIDGVEHSFHFPDYRVAERLIRETWPAEWIDDIQVKTLPGMDA
jgi:hypothetical protein